MQYTILPVAALLALAAAAPAPVLTASDSGISLTGFFASDQCKFTSTTFDAGLGCQNFPAPVQSFTNHPVNIHQMVIYAGAGCTGAGTTLHLDFEGCQNASINAIEGLHQPGSKTAASYCLLQESVACP